MCCSKQVLSDARGHTRETEFDFMVSQQQALEALVPGGSCPAEWGVWSSWEQPLSLQESRSVVLGGRVSSVVGQPHCGHTGWLRRGGWRLLPTPQVIWVGRRSARLFLGLPRQVLRRCAGRGRPVVLTRLFCPPKNWGFLRCGPSLLCRAGQKHYLKKH